LTVIFFEGLKNIIPCFLGFRSSVEEFAAILMDLPLYMIYRFSLAAFNILSLFCIFNVLTIVCQGSCSFSDLA
jgi:hypothetical protein